MKFDYPIITLLFLSSFCLENEVVAQSDQFIKGTVLSIEGNEPLVGASVYFNGTSIGVFTDTNGDFELPYDPLFSEIVISYIGYETISYRIPSDQWSKKFKFILEVEAESIDPVNISSVRGESWYRNLRAFTRTFIGNSKIARQTEIINPDILSFSEEGGVLKAFGASPLKVENKALGYLLEYDLIDYNYAYKAGRVNILGYTKFTELEGSKRQKNKWLKNRAEAYNGSFSHFVHHLQKGSIDGSGFRIYQLNNDDDIIKENHDPTSNVKLKNDMMQLSFEGKWKVAFKEKGRNQVSTIRLLTEAIIFDKYGIPRNPLDLLFRDYWMTETMAYLLPLDYLRAKALEK